MFFEGSVIKSGIQRLTAVLDRALVSSKRESESALFPHLRAADVFQADRLNLAAPVLNAKGPGLLGLTLRKVKSPLPLAGGHNPVEVVQDQFNALWLAKGLFQRNARYRALGDEVGSSVARKAGLNTPRVFFAEIESEGRMLPGTLQPLVKHSGKRLAEDPLLWTAKQRDQLTASHVVRWLLGDHDGKAANFLVMEAGDLVAIDFGNMFRNAGRDELSRHYAPNPEPTLYNMMWEEFVKGRIDVNFKAGFEQIARIEAISDKEFVNMLKPYAEARYSLGGVRPRNLPTKESFLEYALKRKQDLRKDLGQFYTGLRRERTQYMLERNIPVAEAPQATALGGSLAQLLTNLLA